MRNSLFVHIFLACLILVVSLVIIFGVVGESRLFDTLSSSFAAIVILSILLLISTASAVISSKFINPLSKITDRISNPEDLSDFYYSNPRFPPEIQKLLVEIIRYQNPDDEMRENSVDEQKIFYALLENIKDGILITDEEGKVILVNSATRQLFDIGNGDVLGTSLAKVLRNYKVNELWQQCRSSRQQESATIEVSQTKAVINCLAAPLYPDKPGSILLLFQDITRVHQLEIVRRDFVSNVSHELRTPLASIKLITETLESGAVHDAPIAKRFLKQMDSEVDNLTQIVEELLELSRIESGQVPLERQWIKPEDLITIAGDRMVMQADRAGLDFSYGCDSSLPSVFVDSHRLGQVLVNLIHNAIKFTPPGGYIETSAFKERNNIIFFVKDNGIGIPARDLERIFERFYKSDRSRTQRGTGLGLSISKHLVEKHGGKIWVESSRSSGSVFKFAIPFSKVF